MYTCIKSHTSATLRKFIKEGSEINSSEYRRMTYKEKSFFRTKATDSSYSSTDSSSIIDTTSILGSLFDSDSSSGSSDFGGFDGGDFGGGGAGGDW